MPEPRLCCRCHTAPRQPNHSWCRACHAAWQHARYAVRAQTEPAFVAANNARTRKHYHTRHRGATTRRRPGPKRQLGAGQHWCWWCQEAHASAAFAPRPGTTRGVSYSCREGLRIMRRASYRRRRGARAPH